LPDFAASSAGLLAFTLPTGFGAGLAGLFRALRALAGGAALARAGMDGFDFAAIFFVFATALAMTANNPREEGSCALTPLWAVPRKARNRFQRYI
jgi:hypothetical protein